MFQSKPKPSNFVNPFFFEWQFSDSKKIKSTGSNPLPSCPGKDYLINGMNLDFPFFFRVPFRLSKVMYAMGRSL